MRWSQFDLKHGLFHVVRQKNGIDSTYLLYGNVIELRKDISILNKSPKGLHKEAQGNALGKSTIIFLSSERA